MSQLSSPNISELEIPGIKILGEVGRGSQSIVYRATRGDKIFAVKIPRENSLAKDSLVRFRREAGVLARGHHPGLAEIVEIGDIQGHPYLVMEYVEGKTLSSILEEGPVSEDIAVGIAKALAGALHIVHGYGLVHRDVKPQNILVDADFRAKLIDFGFAGVVDDVHIKDKDAIVGTFLYSPPEQTGVLKRPIDGRTDLYSLGISLFECVTGTTPYRSKDPAELIRLHAVMAPPDVREFSPEVSVGFAAIINKLLGKDPDDRYQSAKGLLFDLERLPEINRAMDKSEEISLDPQTDLIEVVGETPLVGRDTELAILRNRWNAVMRGSGTFVLIEGEPGSGKSRLIREVIVKCRTPLTVVLKGKCFQRGTQLMAPLRDAIDSHLKYIQTLPAAQRRNFEDRIRSAAGEIASLLKRFSPALADILKTSDEGNDFSDAQDLFYYAVADFILRYAQSSGGACLFIDDIQWIDDATKQVLIRIADQLGESPLFIATAGRNNAECLQAVTQFAIDLRKSISTRLRLMPLVEGAVAKLVSAHLGGTQVDPAFVQQILNRANGNPFAVGEYVRSMLDSGLLRPSWGVWIVDTAGLEKLSIPTDVEELVVKRIEELGETTKEILRAAAVVGSRFTIETLPVVSGATLPQVNTAL
ncbi:MAG: AAA family ATPase, partial [Bdellovibrionota bacterium]